MLDGNFLAGGLFSVFFLNFFHVGFQHVLFNIFLVTYIVHIFMISGFHSPRTIFPRCNHILDLHVDWTSYIFSCFIRSSSKLNISDYILVHVSMIFLEQKCFV